MKKMKNKTLLITIAILIIAMRMVAQETGTFTDSRDGKTYKTVVIGTQTWMSENLAYKAGANCWAYDNDTTNVIRYGYLYSWEIAKNVCPTGWHLPSHLEWFTLISFLGDSSTWNKQTKKIIRSDGIFYEVKGSNVAGGKAKSTNLWLAPNTDASNASGFSAIPSGLGNRGIFYEKEKNAFYWSSFNYGDQGRKFVLCFVLYYNQAAFLGTAFENSYGSSLGCSVRCIKN